MNADTNRPKMSAPTPETDNLARGNHVVPTEWAEQLERKRDEALIDRANGDIATMTINHYERILRERDEAREARNECERQFQEKVCEIAQLLSERDEALELLASEKITRNHIIKRSVEVERERNEAWEAAAMWESSFDAMERAGAEQARRADENREWALKAEKERDEAREQAQRLRVQLNHYTQANEMAEQAFSERNKAHKIAEQAIEDLAWFNETNANRLRDELEQLKEEAK